MVCKKCGKMVPTGQFICPECNGKSINNFNTINNKLSKDGRMSEYITEKYNNGQGVYAEKNENKNNNSLVVGLIIVFTIIAIIAVVAILSLIG